MSEQFLNQMSKDLGIVQFNNENETMYICRIVYSGLAAWIKASALDTPIGRTGDEQQGVSKRHVFNRCSMFLNMIINMHPEIQAWFYPLDSKVDPVVIVRNRLIRRKEILNVGFGTNITLTKPFSEDISLFFKDVKGEILNDSIQYSGVSTISIGENDTVIPLSIDNPFKWLKDYCKSAWWQSGNVNDVQYFNAYQRVSNNALCWQDSMPTDVKGLILSRKAINQNNYEYYILNTSRVTMHKIDPFLIDMGIHRTIMFALRQEADNPVSFTIERYSDHCYIRLPALLPAYEQQLLETYAWPCKQIDDSISWIMPIEIAEYIIQFINAFGNIAQEVKNG